MYLALDTEDGGIGDDLSILTLGMVFLNDQLEKVEEVHLKLIPDNKIYHVTASGMSVNKIDLVQLEKEGISYRDAGTKIYKLLSLYYTKSSRITVVGKGIHGDLSKIWKHLIRRDSWETFCAYSPIEISSVVKFLVVIGKLPHDMPDSLEGMGEYFGLDTSEIHDALFDARLTAQVWIQLIYLMRQ